MRTSFRATLLAVATLAVALPAAWAQPASPPAGAATPPAATGQGPRGPGHGGPGHGGPGRAAAVFDEMDGNKDSRVTWDEAWSFVQRRFAAADTDRDGGLSRGEADALRPSGGRRRAEGSANAPATPPTPEQEARRGRFGDMMFRSIDANRDGRVTLDEVRPMIEARFRGLDADADNAVSRAELPQRRQGPRPNGGPSQQGGQGAAPAPAR